jgi:hypothetical protein
MTARQKTDEQITEWLDRLSMAQLRLWAAPEPKRAVGLDELAQASGIPFEQLHDEAQFWMMLDEEYAAMILGRITDDPLYARARQMAEDRWAQQGRA